MEDLFMWRNIGFVETIRYASSSIAFVFEREEAIAASVIWQKYNL